MSFFRSVCVLLLCSDYLDANNSLDSVDRNETHGVYVVSSVAGLIQSSCIFPNDYGFIKRTAFVESRFGDITDWYSPEIANKGIWGVSSEQVDFVKNNLDPSIKQKLWDILNININDISFGNGDLRKPINAGVEFLSFMSTQNKSIPVGIADQANFWAQYYRNNASQPKYFIDALALKPNSQSCRSQLGILVLIIDSSDNITADEFNVIRTSIDTYLNTSGIIIGPANYKIGIVAFSNTADITVNFDSYASKEELQKLLKMNPIPHLGGIANISDGLTRATELFIGDDREIPRLAVLITRGIRATDGILKAANALKQKNVELFTVAVDADEEVFASIASDVACMHHYQFDNFNKFGENFATELNSVTCNSFTNLRNSSGSIKIDLSQGEIRFFEFSNLNLTIGIGFTLTVTKGGGHIFLSTTEKNPTQEVHDAARYYDEHPPDYLHFSQRSPHMSSSGFLYMTVTGSECDNRLVITYSTARRRDSIDSSWIFVLTFEAILAIIFICLCVAWIMAIITRVRRKSIYKNIPTVSAALTNLRFTRPINLSNHYEIASLISSDFDHLLDQEYQSLKAVGPTAHHYEYVDYRSLLSATESVDYTEAHLIRGCKQNLEYIAVVSPKAESEPGLHLQAVAAKFLELIIRRNIQIVVRIVSSAANESSSCVRYWPTTTEETLNFEDISVSLAEHKSSENVSMALLGLSKDGLSHVVRQFVFHNMDLASNSEVMLSFVESVLTFSSRESANDPILVECSDNVAQAGTFIALHELLQQLTDNYTMLDVFNTVYNLRKQQACMVDSKNQYVLIYRVLGLAAYQKLYSRLRTTGSDHIYEEIDNFSTLFEGSSTTASDVLF